MWPASKLYAIKVADRQRQLSNSVFPGGCFPWCGVALAAGEYVLAFGDCITGGSGTWFYEPDQPFYLSDSTREACVEIEAFLLAGGKYGICFRPGAMATGKWRCLVKGEEGLRRQRSAKERARVLPGY